MASLHNKIDPESQIIKILQTQQAKTNLNNYTSTTQKVKIDTQPLLAIIQQPDTTIKTVWYNILQQQLEPDYHITKTEYENIWRTI